MSVRLFLLIALVIAVGGMTIGFVQKTVYPFVLIALTAFIALVLFTIMHEMVKKAGVTSE